MWIECDSRGISICVNRDGATLAFGVTWFPRFKALAWRDGSWKRIAGPFHVGVYH